MRVSVKQFFLSSLLIASFSLMFVKTDGKVLRQWHFPICCSFQTTNCFRLPSSRIASSLQAVKQRKILGVHRWHYIVTLHFDREYLSYSRLRPTVTMSSELEHSAFDSLERSQPFYFYWGNVHRCCQYQRYLFGCFSTNIFLWRDCEFW